MTRTVRILTYVAGTLVTIAFVVMCVTTSYASWRGVQILEGQQPITRRVDCVGSAQLRLLASTLQLLSIPLEERDDAAQRLTEAAAEADRVLLAGGDPCALHIPPIVVPE